MVTGLANCSPVLPSNTIDCPEASSPALTRASLTLASLAPSKTGVAIGTPFVTFCAA